MFTIRRIAAWVLLAAVTSPALAQTQKASQSLSEDRIARMIELKIKDAVIVSAIEKQGIAFPVDDAVIDRLKAAMVPDVILDAIRKAGAPKPEAGAPKPEAGAPKSNAKPVTYQDVADLLSSGIPETELLELLKGSPTTFTLDKKQVEELKRLGATDKLLAAMSSVRTPLDAASEIGNLAIALDCSGSMSERTPDGRTKMEAARQAAIKLVQEMPEHIRLAFIVYGHNRAQECEAVQVIWPLEPLDAKGKQELVRRIAGLQPVGSTPIALALRTAGQELTKSNAPSGVVLISDGKEMCGGNPASEAAGLTRRLKQGFGVQVVGFGVKPDERKALEEIATAGQGKYYDAPTPAALRDVVQMLAKRIEEEAKPAPTGSVVRTGRARSITVQRPAIQLPPVDTIYLTPAGTSLLMRSGHQVTKCTQYGQKMRVPPTTKVEKFELWWEPKKGNGWPVRMVTNLTLSEGDVVVKPEEHLGVVRVIGKDLPAPKKVMLSPTGQGSEIITHEVQWAGKYGEDMVVPAGTYDLWVEPADGSRRTKEVEKLEVTAGKTTVIE